MQVAWGLEEEVATRVYKLTAWAGFQVGFGVHSNQRSGGLMSLYTHCHITPSIR